MFKEINYAIVEKTRPPVYTAMKYWGKKPHNVWSEYIDHYVKSDGVVLDPFSGSNVSGIEALKLGKKTVNFDINPLSTFLLDTFLSDFDISVFEKELKKIINKIENNKEYKKHFHFKCPKCGNEEATIQHKKIKNNSIYEFGLICYSCDERFIVDSKKELSKLNSVDNNVKITKWYPKSRFSDSDSFTNGLIKNLGGNTYDKLWTPQNLFVLTEIFNYITNGNLPHNLQLQFLFGFIQSLHISSRMCVPRSKSSNRDFSTSWGRPAYINSKKEMEMNPLILFQNNCIGKQSVESSMKDFKNSVSSNVKGFNVNEGNLTKTEISNYDIIYGTINVQNLKSVLPKNSVDFIITDPPYGGLIKYLDLSQIWLIWLEKFNVKYKAKFDQEITINNKSGKSIDDFEQDFTVALKNINYVLKDTGKLVLTFNNNDIAIWNSFLSAIHNSGFVIESVVHQLNKRTGEANVSNPYGTSATDFYIRCIKRKNTKSINIAGDDFEEYIVQSAVEIINKRNEPTPYQILFNSLLVEFSLASLKLTDYDNNIKKILQKRKDVFVITNSKEVSGNRWWVKPEHLRKDNPKPLSKRVETELLEIYKSNGNSSYDEILQKIFIKFPNSYTPDMKILRLLYNKIFKDNKEEN